MGLRGASGLWKIFCGRKSFSLIWLLEILLEMKGLISDILGNKMNFAVESPVWQTLKILPHASGPIGTPIF